MTNSYTKAALLGTIAGMRAMSAPALVSMELAQSASNGRGLLGRLNSGIFPLILRGLAVGEFLGDKLPSTPSRIKPAPLIARTISGAVSGAAVCAQDENESAVIGAIIGASAALASSFLFYYLRHSLVSRKVAPDYAIALVEDSIVVAAGRLITR